MALRLSFEPLLRPLCRVMGDHALGNFTGIELRFQWLALQLSNQLFDW